MGRSRIRHEEKHCVKYAVLLGELVGASAPGEGRQGLFKRPYKLCPCGSTVVFTYASGGGFEYLSRHIDPETSRYCEQDIR